MSYRIGDLLFKACYDGKLDEVKRLLRELRTTGFTCPVHLPYDETQEDEEQATPMEYGNDNRVGYADLRRDRNGNDGVGQQDDTDAFLGSDWEESYAKTFGADKASEEEEHEQEEEQVRGSHHASEFGRGSSSTAEIRDKNNNSTNTSTSTLQKPPPPQPRVGQSQYHQSINPSLLDSNSCRCPFRRLYTAPTWRRESEVLRYSLLHAAISIGNVPIVEVLLKETRVGCFRRHCKSRRSVAAGGTNNRRPLLLGRSSSSGACACSQCSKLLIDVNQANGGGKSAALMAVKLLSPSPATIPILNLLADTGELDTGADSDTVTGSSMLTALFEACRRDQLSVVETLISTCGVDYTRTSAVDGSSVLVNCRSIHMLQYFADLYEASRPSATISSAAFRNKHTTAAAAASLANTSIATLHLAPFAVLTRLLSVENSSPQAQTNNVNNDEEITKTENNTGTNDRCMHANSRGGGGGGGASSSLPLPTIGERQWIEGRMGRGKTVLHVAAESSDDLFSVEMCRILVDRFGCDPHAVDVEGCTVLRRVADGSGSIAKARYFALECGVDPNKSDDGGWERTGGSEEDDADYDVHDANSLAPVDGPEKRRAGGGRTRHAELMKRRAATVRCKTFGFGGERRGLGLSPLAAACYRGKPEMVAFFVSLGSYIIDDMREVLSALSSSSRGTCSNSSGNEDDHQTQAAPSQQLDALQCPEKPDKNESEETDVDNQAGARMLMPTCMRGNNNNNNSTNTHSRSHSTTNCHSDNDKAQHQHPQGRPHYYNTFAFDDDLSDVDDPTAHHTHRSPHRQEPHAALLQRVHTIRRENRMALRRIMLMRGGRDGGGGGGGGGGGMPIGLASVFSMLDRSEAPMSIDGKASISPLRPLVDVDGLSECNGVTAVIAAVASVVVGNRRRATTIADDDHVTTRAHPSTSSTGGAVGSGVALDGATTEHLRPSPRAPYMYMYTEQEQILSLLLSQGASTNAKCTAATFMIAREGETALHVAVRDGKYELVALLTDFGADPTAVDASGQIPATLLVSCGRRPTTTTTSTTTGSAVRATHTDPLRTSSSTYALGSSKCAVLRSGRHAPPASADPSAASSPFATAHLTGRVGGFGRRSDETEGRTAVPNVSGLVEVRRGEVGVRTRGRGHYQEAFASSSRGAGGGRGRASERGDGRGRAHLHNGDDTEEEEEVYAVRPRGGGGGSGRGRDYFGSSFLDERGREQGRGRSLAQHRGAYVRGSPEFLGAQGASTASSTTRTHQPALPQPPPPRLRDAQSQILSLFS